MNVVKKSDEIVLLPLELLHESLALLDEALLLSDRLEEEGRGRRGGGEEEEGRRRRSVSEQQYERMWYRIIFLAHFFGSFRILRHLVLRE
jgi:hypothetical protein